MKKRYWIFSVFALLLIIYSIGPRPQKPQFDPALPAIPQQADELEHYVLQNEKLHRLREDNHARIVWFNDSTRQKTEYAVVYLHGFSASQKEGDPTHLRFAKQFGCNLYLARLADHGIDTTEMLLNLTADRLWESAKEALAIGKQLGNKIIIMSTSTGGTLALKLAADYPNDVFALINMSPNIRLKNPAARILNDPWGLQIARLIVRGKYISMGLTPDSARWQYWSGKYRIESVMQLQELLEQTMKEETFKKIKQPSLTLYYYKNEKEQDPQVQVSKMLWMNEHIGTPPSQKVAIAVPSAGAHVLGSSMTSKDVEGVYKRIEEFAVNTLGLK